MLQLMSADRRNTENVVRSLDATTNRVKKPDTNHGAHRFKPDKYQGSSDGSIDSWLTMMRTHLEQLGEIDENEKKFLVISYLAKEARAFILNKLEAGRDIAESLFRLLFKQFGSGDNRSQARAE